MTIGKIIAGTFAAGIAAGVSLGIYGLYSAMKAEHASSLQRWEQRWEESQRPIEATVLSESYENTLSPVKEVRGIVSYSNPTVKLDSKYTLKIKTEGERVLALSVIDGVSVKKEALDQLIEEGSRISFPSGNLIRPGSLGKDRGETWFTAETQAGSKRADRITVMD